jgi:4-amino-4-deoxy-L-arabinose transferase-like glycosyltransferase
MSSEKFWRILLLILMGAMLVYLVGNQSVGLWDRDEPRYAECSREMIQTDDWVVPRFLGQWRLEKPPLMYWCQAAAMCGAAKGAMDYAHLLRQRTDDRSGEIL